MPHEVDEYGSPIDPELKRLETELQYLAGYFRGALGNDKEREEIVAEYLATFEKMYELGWDGSLDIQSELPSEYMPQRYIEKYPQIDIFDFRKKHIQSSSSDVSETGGNSEEKNRIL